LRRGIHLQLEDVLKDKHTLTLLHNLLEGTIPEIKELQRIKVNLHYPELEETLGISSEEAAGLVKKLFDEKILVRKTHDNVLCCPKCHSIEIHLEFFCPKCGSPNLLKDVLIEHYSCGYVAVEEEFLKGSEYFCPKCRKPLKQIGVDYSKPGIAYKCLDCSEEFSNPTEKWICQNCDNKFETQGIFLRDLYLYKLNPDVINKLSSIFFDVRQIVDYFKERGYKTERPAILKGVSGLTHRFDISAVKGKGNESRRILVRIFLSPTAVTCHDILTLYAEAWDAKPDGLIVIAVPELESAGKEYAETYNVTYIETDRAEDAAKKLDAKNWESLEFKHTPSSQTRHSR
jgi:hypothetical protein